jgi:transcriptional regulator with XRE-family HTH domain
MAAEEALKASASVPRFIRVQGIARRMIAAPTFGAASSPIGTLCFFTCYFTEIITRYGRMAVVQDCMVELAMKMLSIQCKMARAALDLGVRDLAQLAKVSADTIARFERGEILKERTVDSIQLALQAAGIEFVPENGSSGIGVRLQKPSTSGAAIEVEDLNSANDE